MRLGKLLSSMTKPELEEIRENLNLTDEEEVVFRYLSKGKSNITVADMCGVSLPTIDNRIKSIRSKLNRLE